MSKLYTLEELQALKLSELKQIAEDLRIDQPVLGRGYKNTWIDLIHTHQNRWGRTKVVASSELQNQDTVVFHSNKMAIFTGVVPGNEFFNLEERPNNCSDWSLYLIEIEVWENPTVPLMTFKVLPEGDTKVCLYEENKEWSVCLDPVNWHNSTPGSFSKGQVLWNINTKNTVTIQSIYSVNNYYWVEVLKSNPGVEPVLTLSEDFLKDKRRFTEYTVGMEEKRILEFEVNGLYIGCKLDYEGRRIEISRTPDIWFGDTVQLFQTKQREVHDGVCVEVWDKVSFRVPAFNSCDKSKLLKYLAQIELATKIANSIEKFVLDPKGFFRSGC